MKGTVRERWRLAKALRSNRYFLRFYYGDRLRDYPLSVAAKLLASRLLFVSHVPLILPEKNFWVRCHGVRMYVNPFAHPVSMDLALGVYEYWMSELFVSLIKEGMTIVDIGAHRGWYSILGAKVMNDSGRVLAFEPDPENCSWIRKNVEGNGFKCIELHQCALSDDEGSATFYTAGGLGSLVFNPVVSVFNVERREITVRTRLLDNALEEEHLPHVDVIKMDVEGADLQVLRGAERTLRNGKTSLLMDVDVHGNAEREELFDFLLSCGFRVYRVGKTLERVYTAQRLFHLDEQGRVVQQKNRRDVRTILATKRT